MSILDDNRGSLFISDIVVVLIVSVVIIATVTAIFDLSNEKIMGAVERSSLERKSMEALDNLIRNPGSPVGWEYEPSEDNIIPGLAINNQTRNQIAYNKVLRLKTSYNTLITTNIFLNNIKSSITIYPMDNSLNHITIGENENWVNVANVISVKRAVKCDYLSNYTIANFDGNQVGNGPYELCINQNHQNNQYNSNSNSSNNNGNFNSSHIWVCKSFTVHDFDLENMDYYLIFSEKTQNPNNYWVLNNPSSLNENENSITNDNYNLNQILSNQLGNSSEKKFYIHLKVENDEVNNLDAVLIAIPKNMDLNYFAPEGLKIDYFKFKDSYIILRTWY
ncbi:MAG: hypothetical protein LBR24_01155 [Methanobrevibacter sp.]|jgi:hypothetical protein|nr:hypothetical protein [Methanobrevibacter sp.]